MFKKQLMLLCLMAATGIVFGQNKNMLLCDNLIKEGVRLLEEGQHAQSLELLLEAESFAKENKWRKQQFLAINNIGANYYSLFDYGEALDNYLEAYTIAIRDLHSKYEMVVLNNIAILYSKEKKFDKSYEYFKKAHSIAIKNKENTKRGLYAVNLGLVANRLGNLNEAKSYFQEAIPLIEGDKNIKQQAIIGFSENLFFSGEYEDAKRRLLSLLPDLKNERKGNLITDVLLLLSRIAYSQNNMSLAAEHAYATLEKSNNVETRLEAFKQLSKIYSKTGKLQLALNMKDSVLFVSNRWNEVKNDRHFETNQVKFDIQNYQNEIYNNKKKMEATKKTFLVLLVTATLIILLIAVALRNTYIQSKQRKIINARNEEVMALELEKEKNEKLLLKERISEAETKTLLERERLKNEIASRNRKLIAKALHLIQRNELLQSIIDDLEQQKNTLKKNESIDTYITKLKGLLDSEKEWRNFIDHFEEVNHGFITTIKKKHPNLNVNDLRFISYIYMKLSNKEIASVFNITYEACRKRKERISKKMNLNNSSNLYNYISSI
ncbi:tetratricopeptide repeat protein [Marixanthomonas sp. SCSIO 43207]|uniref:tetratricopeptide repeat protein n=1 Tax=Marixanthomonas sp. SCSIO 43207 TaxID=2779360 RepID=UPI001CA82252|nr:tetratricopeptide repeat protein [Marixanthomonas sp. SCSIO 43207]UAB82394.1 tetratricopeptide repeat protein [Marixanthomonas sp. SCSIO 43207]